MLCIRAKHWSIFSLLPSLLDPDGGNVRHFQQMNTRYFFQIILLVKKQKETGAKINEDLHKMQLWKYVCMYMYVCTYAKGMYGTGIMGGRMITFRGGKQEISR